MCTMTTFRYLTHTHVNPLCLVSVGHMQDSLCAIAIPSRLYMGISGMKTNRALYIYQVTCHILSYFTSSYHFHRGGVSIRTRQRQQR